MDKTIARARGIRARALLSPAQRSDKSHAVCMQVIKMIRTGMMIGCYVSVKDELNTSEILDHCFKNNISVCVPKVKGKTLEFFQILSFDDLKPASFGLLEPVAINRVQCSEIDLMIVPLTSFDSMCHRTGYGKGYYDSILLECRNRIGVAYAEQMTEYIDVDEHDVTLHDVIFK